MRTDRFVTMSLFDPLRRVGLGAASTGRLPILMYHSISEAKANGSPAYFQVGTRPEIFEGHMRLLHEAGYSVVGLEAGMDLLLQRGVKTSKLVALTFDDGFRDFYTTALPVLKRFGFSATMYLPTSFIGDEPRPFMGTECMTWAEVRESRGQGIEFGSHTVTHPKLVDLDEKQLWTEIEASKSILEEKLGEPVKSFAYPYAFPAADTRFLERFKAILRAAGYTSNVTTRVGRAQAGDCPFALPRLPVNSADDDGFFMAKIQGSYDWLSFPQNAFKRLKKIISPRPPAAAMVRATRPLGTK